MLLNVFIAYCTAEYASANGYITDKRDEWTLFLLSLIVLQLLDISRKLDEIKKA